MFVDVTGRRRRAAIVVGGGLGVFMVLGLIALAVGMLTSSRVPLPGWPETVQRGAEIAPTPAPVAPTSPSARSRTPPAAATTTGAAEPTRTNGNGNGGAHGGRPSKTPGKP